MSSLDDEAHALNGNAIREMSAAGFLNASQAALLHQANDNNSSLASWFVATIEPHALAGETALSNPDFARLCNMGVHRFRAQSGTLPNAPESPKVQEVFNALGGLPTDTSDGPGLGRYVRNYLTRTPKSAGEALVENLGKMLTRQGKNWMDLAGDPRPVYEFRAAAEHAYIATIPDAVTLNLPHGGTLNDLLRAAQPANKLVFKH